MAADRLTRRQCVGAIGTAITAGLSGCIDALTPQSDSPPTDTPPTTTTATTRQSETASNGTAASERNIYTQVYQKTIPSVVLLRVTNQSGKRSQGTGFIFRETHLVTNAHVVADAQAIQVRFSRGQWRTASVSGVDPSSDLAALTVQQPPDYATPLPVAARQPPIGTRVVVIGSPYGLEGSLTTGLISGVNRSISAPNGYTIPDAIQTSVPVNPGNSGGPLVTLDRNVVGVVNSGGGENLAFAISAPLLKRVIPALIKTGDYDHPYMGIASQTVIPSIANQLGLPKPEGVLVTDIRPNSPAANVLQPKDVIVKLDDTQIASSQQLGAYLALQTAPNDTVKVTVRRDGARQTVTLTLGTRPERPIQGTTLR